MNPWSNKILRSVYDPDTQGYWFSVIDLCALLTGSDHKTARGYWKWLKDKQNSEKNQLVSVTNQLKFEAADGKQYFSEVIDFKNLIRLIQTCPSPKANPYRQWVADMLLADTPAAELEKQLAELGKEYAAEIMEKYKDNPDEQYELLVVQREKMFAET